MSYEPEEDFQADLAEEPDPTARSKPGPTAFALTGLLVGFVVGFGVAWTLGGNPFSDTNEVVFRELVVEQVDEERGRLCWAVDPGRRDSPLDCAILALDPEVPVPEEGQEVIIGIVEVSTPDGQEFRQVVHVGQPGAAPPDEG